MYSLSSHPKRSIAALFLAAFFALTSGLKADADSDIDRIQDLTAQWAAAWNIGAGDFDGEAFRPLFASDEIEVFDNVQGDVVVLRTIDDYIETWVPFMEPLQHWSVEVNHLRVRVSGDLATSTFRLDGIDTRGPSGEPIPFGQYGTHIWQKYPELGWRIVHEHLTSYDRGNALLETAPESETTKIQSIDHISISTHNPKLVDWYREILDFEIEDQWTAPEVVPGLELMYLIHPSGTRLEIAVGNPVTAQGSIPGSIADDFAKAGFRHLCFAVENVDETIAIAETRGAKVMAAPFDFPYLKKRLAFLQDPDGNAIEFVQPM